MTAAVTLLLSKCDFIFSLHLMNTPWQWWPLLKTRYVFGEIALKILRELVNNNPFKDFEQTWQNTQWTIITFRKVISILNIGDISALFSANGNTYTHYQVRYCSTYSRRNKFDQFCRKVIIAWRFTYLGVRSFFSTSCNSTLLKENPLLPWLIVL